MRRTYRSYIAVSLTLIILSNLAACAKLERVKMKRRMGPMPEKYKNDGAPRVGDVAYLFKLETVDGDRQVDISKAAGVRPVALFFGSYT